MGWLRNWAGTANTILRHPDAPFMDREQITRQDALRYIFAGAVTPLLLISGFVLVLVLLAGNLALPGTGPVTVSGFTLVFLFLLLYVSAVLVGILITGAVLVYASLLHQFISRWGDYAFEGTLTVMSYCMAVFAVVAWIPHAAFLIGTLAGFEPVSPASMLLHPVGLLFGITVALYLLFVQERGLEEIHDMSARRARFAVGITALLTVSAFLVFQLVF